MSSTASGDGAGPSSGSQRLCVVRMACLSWRMACLPCAWPACRAHGLLVVRMACAPDSQAHPAALYAGMPCCEA